MSTTCTIPRCGRELRLDERRRSACGRCEHRIRAWLRELPYQVTLLQACLTPDRAPTTGNIHGGRAHSPMPVRLDVLTLLGPGADEAVTDPLGDQAGPTPLPAVIRSWAQLLAESRGKPLPRLRPGETYAGYLRAHLPYALTQEWIADLHDELAQAIRRARAITHTEPQRHPQDAPCPGCEAFGLVEEDWQQYLECTACGLLLTREEYTEHARTVLPPLYRTALMLVAGQERMAT
jgi:hypothetical protein